MAKYFDNLVEIDEYRRGGTTAGTKEQDIQAEIPKRLPNLRDRQRMAVEHSSKYIISLPDEDLRYFGIQQTEGARRRRLLGS